MLRPVFLICLLAGCLEDDDLSSTSSDVLRKMGNNGTVVIGGAYTQAISFGTNTAYGAANAFTTSFTP